MTVTVLLFSSYAEAFGSSSLHLELRDGSTVRELMERIRSLSPVRTLPPALVAVNQEYADPDSTVQAGSEIAVIPPVAGG
jgi:molybdopterin converting factor subunit 1